MNNTILINLIARVEKIEFTHNYIFGFAYNGNIYSYNTIGLNTGIVLDKASSKNGGGYSLRFKLNQAQKQALINSCICTLVCSEEYFINYVNNSKYNKGEIFEKIITEKFGQKWSKDNVPFYKGADLTVNDIAYSIKFEKATICTESTIMRIESLKQALNAMFTNKLCLQISYVYK